MKMYRERRVQQVSCVAARGGIAVAAVMKDSPVWSCHGATGSGGEAGHSHNRKSASALMGTYRSLRGGSHTGAIHNNNTTPCTPMHSWILTKHLFLGLLSLHLGSKINSVPRLPTGGELRKLDCFSFPFAAYSAGRGVNSSIIYYARYTCLSDGLTSHFWRRD